MSASLADLRQTPQLAPSQFLAAHPGCWIQYYDDTGEKDPAKALSSRSFDLAVAQRKQQDRCAVCFSLQAFGGSRTKRGLLCYRNLGVDIDLIPGADRESVSAEQIDHRKDEYLTTCLSTFPLRPHWLVETRHGFHAVFRIRPLRDALGVAEAEAVNRRLVRALRGDENAALLTQVLRVPGTLQFEDPKHPFLCRLLLDDAGTIEPYDLGAVRGVLDAWEVFHGGRGAEAKSGERDASGEQPFRSRDGLQGVPEGRRNCAAASVVGGILGRLPEYLWETAGWGGLREWNRQNAVPLPERELRSVFESIARRERAGRRLTLTSDGGEGRSGVQIRIDVHIRGVRHAESHTTAATIFPPNSDRTSFPHPPC